MGGGLLLVCGYDLSSNLDGRPAARQFRRSLFRYAASPAFRPAAELPFSWVERRFAPAGLSRLGARVLKADSEDRENGNVAANAIDGDASTFWHTRWQPANDPMPHELVIDLGRELTLKGITCLPRQDQVNGRIADAQIFFSLSPAAWGDPVATVNWANTAELQTIHFGRAFRGRYLRLVAKSEVNGNPFAAVAELDTLMETQ